MEDDDLDGVKSLEIADSNVAELVSLDVSNISSRDNLASLNDVVSGLIGDVGHVHHSVFEDFSVPVRLLRIAVGFECATWKEKHADQLVHHFIFIYFFVNFSKNIPVEVTSPLT